MNKKMTAAVLAAVLPLSLQIYAQDTAADKEKLVQVHTEETLPVPAAQDTGLTPVNLDQAAASYDVVLPQQPVKMTADKLLMRKSDNYVAARGNVDIAQGMDEMHALFFSRKEIIS